MTNNQLRKEIEQIVRELDCGYCETSHNHEESRIEGIDQLLALFDKYVAYQSKEIGKEK